MCYIFTYLVHLSLPRTESFCIIFVKSLCIQFIMTCYYSYSYSTHALCHVYFTTCITFNSCFHGSQTRMMCNIVNLFSALFSSQIFWRNSFVRLDNYVQKYSCDVAFFISMQQRMLFVVQCVINLTDKVSVFSYFAYCIFINCIIWSVWNILFPTIETQPE